MLRRAFVLLGLAVLLSLFFPVAALMRQGGIDPSSLWMPGVDLVVLCAVIAVLPAMLLARDGQLRDRIPRWNVWIALVPVFCLLFLLLHVGWTKEFAATWLRDAMADGTLPLRVPEQGVLHVLELATRIGVVVCMTGVLLTLQAVPSEDEVLAQRRRSRSRSRKK